MNDDELSANLRRWRRNDLRRRIVVAGVVIAAYVVLSLWAIEKLFP